MKKPVTLALVDPDGTEHLFELEVGQNLTLIQPFYVKQDRFDIDGSARVVLRRVT